MSSLLELQSGFRRALLAGDDEGIRGLILDDGLGAGGRLDVYRNNVVSSLTEVLAETFPAVSRLVDPRFFAYAAHEFLTAHPPTRPCLSEYGNEFPSFIADFEPCRHLVYLADVAHLEWLVHLAAYAKEAEPLSADTLRRFAPDETPRIVLGLHPAIGHLASPWPIDRIWSANREANTEEDGIIDLDAGRVWIEVARTTHGIAVRSLDAATFAFRNTLRRGRTLERAAEAALACDPAFDLATSLADVFRTAAAVTVGLAVTDTAEGSDQ